MSIKNEAKAFSEHLECEIAKVSQEYQSVFLEGLKKNFFSKHPEILGIRFEAYTDYFNDGEQCNYYARVDYPKIKFNDSKEYIEGYDKYNNWNEETHVEWVELREFLRAFSHETYRILFGDHVQITAELKNHEFVIKTKTYKDHD